MREKLVLWGTGAVGKEAYIKLKDQYEIVAFGDNDIYKQGLIYRGLPVISFEKLVDDFSECKVLVSITDYYEEAKKIDEHSIQVIGYYDVNLERILPWKRISWDDVKSRKKVHLYAGDVNINNYDKYPDDYVICLSLNRSNYRSIQHDITLPYPIENNSIDSYQIEDVLEHIELDKAVSVINEVYRILKPEGGYLRLSLPDYHTPRLIHRSFLNAKEQVVYDPGGGGRYVNGVVMNGGHVWFPTYENVLKILEESEFERFRFYRYHDVDGNLYSEDIDYAKGYIDRTRENLSYKEDNSIVVDCYK